MDMDRITLWVIAASLAVMAVIQLLNFVRPLGW